MVNRNFLYHISPSYTHIELLANPYAAPGKTPEFRAQETVRDGFEETVLRHLLARGHALAKKIRQIGLRSVIAHAHAPAMRRPVAGCKGREQ